MDRQDRLEGFSRLSPRMRECLRLVYQRKSSKAIARTLVGPSGEPLNPGTVDNYIAQAIHLLSATDRYEAADLLHSFELSGTSDLQVQPSGVERIDPSIPTTAPARSPWWRTLPIRLTGATENDFTIVRRLINIFLIAFGIAVGFGSIASGLNVFSQLARDHAAQ